MKNLSLSRSLRLVSETLFPLLLRLVSGNLFLLLLRLVSQTLFPYANETGLGNPFIALLRLVSEALFYPILWLISETIFRPLPRLVLETLFPTFPETSLRNPLFYLYWDWSQKPFFLPLPRLWWLYLVNMNRFKMSNKLTNQCYLIFRVWTLEFTAHMNKLLMSF